MNHGGPVLGHQNRISNGTSQNSVPKTVHLGGIRSCSELCETALTTRAREKKRFYAFFSTNLMNRKKFVEKEGISQYFAVKNCTKNTIFRYDGA